MKIHHLEIEKLEELINKKLPNGKKYQTGLETLADIICVISKHLIKAYGYSVASTIMKRELRKIGKRDARKLTKLLNIKSVNEESIKNILDAAAIILGIKLGLYNGKVIVKSCPFFHSVKKVRDPFICNVCTEYNKGIVDELTNSMFTLRAKKKLSRGDKYCVYDVVKRE